MQLVVPVILNKLTRIVEYGPRGQYGKKYQRSLHLDWQAAESLALYDYGYDAVRCQKDHRRSQNL